MKQTQNLPKTGKKQKSQISQNFKSKHTFWSDASEGTRENLTCNILLVHVPSVVRELSPKKTIYRLLRFLNGFHRYPAQISH